jgi:hypothetical protein
MIARIAMKSIRMATPVAVPIGVLVMADIRSIEGCRCVTVAVHAAVTAGVLIAAKAAKAQVALEVDFEGVHTAEHAMALTMIAERGRSVEG